jgi:hypothetical protein
MDVIERNEAFAAQARTLRLHIGAKPQAAAMVAA